MSEKNLTLPEQAAELCEKYRCMGYHCSESTLRSCADVLGITLSEDLLKISSVFRGGGGGWGGRCGVAEAGCMLLGLLYGRSSCEEDVQFYSKMVQLLMRRFTEEFASTECRTLRPHAYKLSGEAQNCSYMYKNGAALVTEVLLEAKKLAAEQMPAAE